LEESILVLVDGAGTAGSRRYPQRRWKLVDEEVVVDQGIVEEFAEGRHEVSQAGVTGSSERSRG
jgi:hypothetical protein